MGTGRSDFWSSNDSNTMMGVGPIGTGTYRSELSDGVMDHFGNQTTVYGAYGGSSDAKELRLEMGDTGTGTWDEKHDARSPAELVSPIEENDRVQNVDGMRFEMIGDTAFKPNEKPLGRAQSSIYSAKDF